MQIRADVTTFIDVFQNRINFFIELADDQLKRSEDSRHVQEKLIYFKQLLIELKNLVLKEYYFAVVSKDETLKNAFTAYSNRLESLLNAINNDEHEELGQEILRLHWEAYQLKTHHKINPIYVALEIGAAVIGGIVGVVAGPVIGIVRGIQHSYKTCGLAGLLTVGITVPVGAIAGFLMGFFYGVTKGYDLAHQRLGLQTKIHDKTKKTFQTSHINLLFNHSQRTEQRRLVPIKEVSSQERVYNNF